MGNLNSDNNIANSPIFQPKTFKERNAAPKKHQIGKIKEENEEENFEKFTNSPKTFKKKPKKIKEDIFSVDAPALKFENPEEENESLYFLKFLSSKTLNFKQRDQILHTFSLFSELKSQFYELHKKEYSELKFLDDVFPLPIQKNLNIKKLEDIFSNKKQEEEEKNSKSQENIFDRKKEEELKNSKSQENIFDKERQKMPSKSMNYGNGFPIEYEKIFEFVPKFKNISYLSQKLKIGEFCTLKGDSDFLAELKHYIKVLSPIEKNMIYDQGREIWIVSPIIEFPDNFKRIFKLKIKFKIDFKRLNYEKKSFKLSKISHGENKNVVKILNSEIKTNAQGEIFLKATLTHFCMVFVSLSNSEVQEVFNENMNNHHLERTCEKVFGNQLNFDVEDIRNCLNHGFGFRGRFDECLSWSNSENCPKNLQKCNKIDLACVRLYTSRFYKELNINLRNFIDYDNWISYITRMKPVLKGIVQGLKQMEFFWGTVLRGVETKDNRFKKGMFVRFQ